MKILKITQYDGLDIQYETDKETALTAFQDWKETCEALGLPIINLIKLKNVELIDENGVVKDAVFKPVEHKSEPIWKRRPRYKDFTEIEPTPFNILFKDKNYKTVQLHEITPLSLTDIVGFVGSISWINNKLTPLDGDTYYPEMLVYGYKENNDFLDILVDDW